MGYGYAHLSPCRISYAGSCRNCGPALYAISVVVFVRYMVLVLGKSLYLSITRNFTSRATAL